MRLALSMCLAAALVLGQTPPPAAASIEGTVTDAITGVPIAAITVSLIGPEILSPVKTDEQGHYLARGLAAGQYLVLAARSAGYAANSMRVRLAPVMKR